MTEGAVGAVLITFGGLFLIFELTGPALTRWTLGQAGDVAEGRESGGDVE